MISFVGMLAAMVSIALATCSLALVVVVYRRTRGSATSRQERQETAQTVPAAAVPATVVAGGCAVDGVTGRLLIIPCWFSRLVVPLDVWSARLVASCLRAVGEWLLSSRVPVGCWPRARWCRGSLLVVRRLVRLWPLVAAWAGQRLATCRVAGRGPPAYDVRLLSLIAAAITPYKPENRGLAQSRLLAPVVKPLKGKAHESYHYPSVAAMVDHRPSRHAFRLFPMADQEILPPGCAARYPAVDGHHCGTQRPLPDRSSRLDGIHGCPSGGRTGRIPPCRILPLTYHLALQTA
nr:MAG TPA: hypothetical protein [Caudoviricetes sp.]